jgi:uncharacterized protein YkwD
MVIRNRTRRRLPLSRFPTLALLAFQLVGLLALATAWPASAAETGELERLRSEALERVNEDRSEYGLKPLELTENLNEAAQNHAEDMLERRYYAHVSPEGETIQDRYIEQGGSRWRLVAGNIARCIGCPSPPTIERIRNLQQGWMDSPGHRANILQEGLDSFGYGIIVGDDRRLYAVQNFAGPGVPRGLQPDEEPVALSPVEQAEQALTAINTAREREGVPRLEPSDALNEGAMTLLPEGEGGSLTLDGELFAALPQDERRAWSALSVLAAGCGGCGTELTAADVRSFRDRWLDNRQNAGTLLAEQMTHLGFAMRAGGEGRKVAVAVVGQHR